MALPVGTDAAGIGRAVVVAELATALAGAAIGVQPFDQPDVAAAKAATNAVLEQRRHAASTPPSSTDLLDQVEPGDHLALQAFVDPGGPTADRARGACGPSCATSSGSPSRLGFGPRFLHSTGQLHKGGPPAIVCSQVLDDDAAEIPIPGRDFGFGHLLAAQAAGDLRDPRRARPPVAGDWVAL